VETALANQHQAGSSHDCDTGRPLVARAMTLSSDAFDEAAWHACATLARGDVQALEQAIRICVAQPPALPPATAPSS
jgi:hypothetical protein